MEKLGRSRREGFAVIVPAYNATDTLSDCIQAILASRRKPNEIIVFDDGRTDNIEEIKQQPTVKVITNPGAPVGPAKGRNEASRRAGSEFLIFVDADVLVAKDAFEILLDELDGDSKIWAAFGSYDEFPRVKRRAALYANLRHHWVHQNGEREAGTFWTGLGAVRTDAFWSVGGFDDNGIEMEDIDLGLRLRRAGGRIRLVPEALGTHCKNWSLSLLWWTDIHLRAIPWATYLVSGKADHGFLNVATRERWSAMFAYACLMTLIGCFFSKWLGIAFVIFLLWYIGLNRGLFALLLRQGGVLTAVAGIILHLLYHLYASGVYMLILISSRLRLTAPGSRRALRRLI